MFSRKVYDYDKSLIEDLEFNDECSSLAAHLYSAYNGDMKKIISVVKPSFSEESKQAVFNYIEDKRTAYIYGIVTHLYNGNMTEYLSMGEKGFGELSETKKGRAYMKSNFEYYPTMIDEMAYYKED